MNRYLIWLEWPEKCFRVDAEALRYLRTLVPRDSVVTRVRSEGSFLRELPRATHAIVWNFKPEWFDRATRLEVLATPAAGRELVPEAGPRGITTHYGHFHGPIMAETVAAFVLAWARGFFRMQELLRASGQAASDWPRTWLSDKCYEVAGTRAVVVGYGNIGRAIGAKLRSLGVTVVGVARHGIDIEGRLLKPTTRRIDAMLRKADWVVLALPSTTGTDGWLGVKRLGLLSSRCVVINVGRGNAVDERALFLALKNRKIAGAYLDVRCHEPSATVLEAPGFVRELAQLPNCILTPHASAFSPNYIRGCFKELRDDGII